jgi:hypothetical protein
LAIHLLQSPNLTPNYISPQNLGVTKNYGTIPNGLYKRILQLKTAGDTNASISTLNGPNSTTCN